MGCAASTAVASQRDMQVTLAPIIMLAAVVVPLLHRYICD
jgi:hypothetical protein